jgi:hypothetical protein
MPQFHESRESVSGKEELEVASLAFLLSEWQKKKKERKKKATFKG